MPITFRAVLHSNSVIVTDSQAEDLLDKGYGSKFVNISTQLQKELLISNKPTENGSSYSYKQDPASSSSVVTATIQSDVIAQPALRGLLLSDEEALYLLTQSVLALTTPRGEPLTRSMFWTHCCTTSNRFHLRYKAYCFFKEKKFVVQSGINFGVDFTIYRTSPRYSHSEICAYVVDGTSGAGLDAEIEWKSLSNMTRVMPAVMKILILCYVSEREDIQTLSDPLDFHDFASLASLIVQPVAVLNRRSVVQESTYETTAEVHKRYRNLSKKKSKKSSRNNSKYTVIKRKRESERVTIDTRAKSRSKTNAVWDELRKESSGETSEEKTEHTNSATIGEENSSVQTYLSRLAKIPFIGKYFVEHRQK